MFAISLSMNFKISISILIVYMQHEKNNLFFNNNYGS
jgi:hypothetical protein